MQGPSIAWKSSPTSTSQQYVPVAPPVHAGVSIHTPAVHVHGNPTVWAQGQQVLGVQAQGAPVRPLHAMPGAWVPVPATSLSVHGASAPVASAPVNANVLNGL